MITPVGLNRYDFKYVASFAVSFILLTNTIVYLQQYMDFLKPMYLYVLLVGLAILKLPRLKLHKTSIYLLVWLVAITALPALSIGLIQNNFLALDIFIIQSWIVLVTASVVVLANIRFVRIAIGYGILYATIFQFGIHLLEFIEPEIRMFSQPATEISDYHGRVTGMHVNPNTSATALVLSFFVSQFLLSRKWRVVFALLAGTCVLVTISRGGILCWVLSVCFSYYLGLYGKPSYRVSFSAMTIVGLLTLLLLTGQIPTLIYAAGLEEHVSAYSMEKLSGGFLSRGDASASLRLGLTAHAWNLFLEYPVTGAGVGESFFLGLFSDYGAHNMYLRLGAELGLLGALSFMALILVPSRNSRYCLCFAVLYLFSAMFNHTSMDYAFYAILLPFGLTMLPTIRLENVARRSQTYRQPNSSIAESKFSTSSSHKANSVSE